MPPTQMTREESWNSLRRSEASGDNVEDGFSDASMNDESDHGSERSTTESPTFPTVSDVHRALHPLQATADRVGKQVEEFAENLDRLSSRNKRSHTKDCSDVLPLIDAYKKIARDTVRRLQSLHAPERQQQLSKKTKRRLRNSSAKSTPRTGPSEDGEDRGMRTSVEDLKRWELEEQTWDLVGLMLQIWYPKRGLSQTTNLNGESRLVRPEKDVEVHRYSSEKDIWNKFLALDDQAWERHTVVQWLKKCAENSGQDIDQVVRELELGADRGSGLWAHSWLYSKEAIKFQKRLRSWPQALEPDDPGLNTSLMNSEKTKSLVTQLDPDAITRQGRSLEQQDYYFERAMWLACWEMLRRGKDWDYVRDWCHERGEGWRATAMRGDPRNARFPTSSPASWQSRALWRKACALAAKDGSIEEYENAVYGVLSGYLPSVLKVCRSWDDYLFAHYNSYLLYSFDRYLKSSFPDRVPATLNDKHGSFNFSVFGGQRTQSGNQIVEKMKHLETTREEATEPLKMLQGSLIANTFDDFVFKHGVRLTQAANAGGRSKILEPFGNDQILEGSVTASISLADHDLLRLLTHIIFVFQDLGFQFGEGERHSAMESIIVAYVDYLSKAGKQQLLPLYASRLSYQTSKTCLGRQLPAIQDRRERRTMMSLMKQIGIDVPGVLGTQLQLIITDTPLTQSKWPALRILEQTSKDASSVRPIQTGFLGDEVTDDQEDLIHGFEWYMLLDFHWQQTMAVGVLVYKHLLRKSAEGDILLRALISSFTIGSNGLAAARRLSQTLSFSTISLGKTNNVLGKPVDISKSQDSSDDEANPITRNQNNRTLHTRSSQRSGSPSAKSAHGDRELMLSQASTFRDFENLFTALDAMEEWKNLADEAVKYIEQRQDIRDWKDSFQKAYKRVETTIEPLLHGWLRTPKNGKCVLYHEPD